MIPKEKPILEVPNEQMQLEVDDKKKKKKVPVVVKDVVLSQFSLSPYVVQVPMYPPLLLTQLPEWNFWWPVSFYKHILYALCCHD